jgi:hypothetical protein
MGENTKADPILLFKKLLSTALLPVRSWEEYRCVAKHAVGAKKKGTNEKKISEGQEITLDIRHFIALTLISIMIEREGRCERPLLEKLYLWKLNRMNETTFQTSVINPLVATDMIEQVPSDNDSRANLITLTGDGKALLRKLKNERNKDINMIVSRLDLKDTSEQAFAKRIWDAVKKDAVKEASERKRKKRC